MRYLSVNQVAEIIGVCPETVRRAIRRGALVACRFNNGRLRIEETWLRGALAAGAIEPIARRDEGGEK